MKSSFFKDIHIAVLTKWQSFGIIRNGTELLYLIKNIKKLSKVL